MQKSAFTGKMQGGEILAKAMALKGIRRIYSLCGGFLNPIYDGCLKHEVEVVGTRHEMEAGFMASAASRINREPVVVLAEPSGYTNYISAVAEAFHSGDPVIFISVGGNFHRLDRQGFKETPRQEELVKTLTKYSIMVYEGNRIHEFFNKAYDIASNLPTGPVQITIPINFVFSHYEMGNEKRPFVLESSKTHHPPLHPDDLELVKELLKGAKKPVMIAGMGVHQSHAEKVIEEVSAKFRIPYFHSNHLEIRQPDFTQSTYMGLCDIHQNPASRLIQEYSDLVIFIGAKMDYCLDWGEPPLFNPETPLVCVNPTSRELSDNQIVDYGILADPKLFLEALSDNAECEVDADWCDLIRNRRIEDNQKLMSESASDEIPIHPLRACIDILELLNENDYLVVDGGDAHGWQETALNITSLDNKNIKGLIMSGPFAQLGVGTSFATAVKMAAPDSRVVVISGDGSFGLNPGLPLETAIHRNIQIVSVILNNQAWGMIQNQQKAIWGRTNATDLRDVPFHEIAKASGAYGELVEKAEEVKPALQRAFDSGKPAVINVKTKNVKSLLTVGLVDRREKSSIE